MLSQKKNKKNQYGIIKKRVLLLSLLLSLAFLLTACSPSQDAGQGKENLDKLVLSLDWTPNTNHTGLYVALEKGWFAQEGLDLEIIQPAEGAVEQLVASGRVDYGVSYQENVSFAREEGMPIVSIGAIIQNNTSGFASLPSKNIKRPADFAGKRYGGWGSEAEAAVLKTLMDKDGADYRDVEILTTGPADFFVSSEKNADFSWIFYGWDGIAAQLRGIDLDYIDLASFDETFNYYTPLLIASQDTVDNEKERNIRFMKAVKKGYEYTIENPQEAAAILLKYAPELDEDLVVASQLWLADKFAAGQPWGIQKEEVWQRYGDWLFDSGLLKEKFAAGEAFTNEFIQ